MISAWALESFVEASLTWKLKGYFKSQLCWIEFCWDKHLKEHLVKVDIGVKGYSRLVKERFTEADTGERMFC